MIWVVRHMLLQSGSAPGVVLISLGARQRLNRCQSGEVMVRQYLLRMCCRALGGRARPTHTSPQLVWLRRIGVVHCARGAPHRGPSSRRRSSLGARNAWRPRSCAPERCAHAREEGASGVACCGAVSRSSIRLFRRLADRRPQLRMWCGRHFESSVAVGRPLPVGIAGRAARIRAARWRIRAAPFPTTISGIGLAFS